MATLRLDQLYTPGSSDKVLELERDLGHEIAELTSELEENEMLCGIAPKITGYIEDNIFNFFNYRTFYVYKHIIRKCLSAFFFLLQRFSYAGAFVFVCVCVCVCV